jgi:hypothetical protein
MAAEVALGDLVNEQPEEAAARAGKKLLFIIYPQARIK